MSSEAFLIIFITFWALITLMPVLLGRFKIPQVIVLLLTGMLIGPNGIDLLGFLSSHLNFLGIAPKTIEQHSLSLINGLGSLGLVFLMTLAGMEADFKLIRTVKRPVIWLSVLTFLLPAISGYLVYAYFRCEDLPGKLLYASLFASHSVGIVFPVVRELKLAKTRFGAVVLISTVVTDVCSIVLLAVSVQLRRIVSLQAAPVQANRSLSLFHYLDPHVFGQWFVLVFLGIAMLFMVGACLVIHPIGTRLLKRFSDREDALVTVFLFIIMLTVGIGEFLGMNLVVGAFVAGLGLSRAVKSSGTGSALFLKLEGIGYGLLIPFLFLSIGMKTDFTILFHSADNLQIILLTIVGLVGSKILSGWLALRICRFGNRKGFCAGLMTVPQLSATLAAAAIGKDLGMLDDNFFNAIVVLSIVTTIPIPTLVRLVIEKGHLRFAPLSTPEAPYELPGDAESDQLI